MPVRPQSQTQSLKCSHRNLRLFKTTDARSNANLSGVSGRVTAAQKKSLFLCKVHLAPVADRDGSRGPANTGEASKREGFKSCSSLPSGGL